MELVDGRAPQGHHPRRARSPVDRGGALSSTASSTALEYSHRAGVVHRDIKPGNVMVTDTGQVKVMDFGIARAVSDSSTTVAADHARSSAPPRTSRPSRRKGETVDARTDLYSTGVVLYEMLTGRPPFRGETPVAVAYQHVSEAPVPPSEINATVRLRSTPSSLRALAKDPLPAIPGRRRVPRGARRDGRRPVAVQAPGRRAHERRSSAPNPTPGSRDGAVAAPAAPTRR